MLTSKTGEERIRCERASDPDYLNETLSELAFRLPRIRVSAIGESVMGRPISMVSVGDCPYSRGVLYVGGLEGTDPFSPAILLRLICELAEAAEADKRLYNIRISRMLESRTIHVLPLLNPDGYAIVKRGAGEIPIRERLIRQNGSEDFSGWTKNARGVELNANFRDGEKAADGVSVCSEPETEALCSWVRLADGATGGLELAITLLPGDEPLRYRSGRVTPSRAGTLGRLLAQMTGTSVCRDSTDGRGFPDWFMRETGKPAFSCGCFPEGQRERAKDATDYGIGYQALREALFSAPML